MRKIIKNPFNLLHVVAIFDNKTVSHPLYFKPNQGALRYKNVLEIKKTVTFKNEQTRFREENLLKLLVYIKITKYETCLTCLCMGAQWLSG